MFLKVMNGLHDRFREKPAKTSELIVAAEQIAGTPLREVLLPWIDQDDLPTVSVSARADSSAEGWQLRLTVRQDSLPYPFRTIIAVESEKALNGAVERVTKWCV
jgi:aminopeptidase N